MHKPVGLHTHQQTEAVLEVVGLSHDGRGVARADGKTVFIDGALPGEQVRCRVIRSKPRFDEARLLEILRPAPDRIVPYCQHYDRCGGCTLQHLAPPAQLIAHQQRLADTLERLARLRPQQWLAPVASEPYGYRSRARLANTEFVQANLALTPEHAAWSRTRYDLVLLDPPRSGAAALLPTLPKFSARRIAYVSCDAATLARDAAVLYAGGAYTLTHAGVFAMFPHTAHFEALAIFAMQGSASKQRF